PCTSPEARPRRPNRAETARPHNGVVLGDWPPRRPWPYLPHGARLHGRPSQWPRGDTLRPKTTLAAAVLRQAEAGSAAPLLAGFAGAYAVETVSRPRLAPPEAPRRSAPLPRVGADGRRAQPLGGRAPAKGRRPGGEHAWPPPNITCPGRSAGSGAGLGGMAGGVGAGTHSAGVAGRSVAPRSPSMSSCSRWQ